MGELGSELLASARATGVLAGAVEDGSGLLALAGSAEAAGWLLADETFGSADVGAGLAAAGLEDVGAGKVAAVLRSEIPDGAGAGVLRDALPEAGGCEAFSNRLLDGVDPGVAVALRNALTAPGAGVLRAEALDTPLPPVVGEAVAAAASTRAAAEANGDASAGLAPVLAPEPHSSSTESSLEPPLGAELDGAGIGIAGPKPSKVAFLRDEPSDGRLSSAPGRSDF